MEAADGLLRHHADLLRQRGAAPRPRVHDDRHRHPRPPHAPARRGGVLPHRHRRARRAGRPAGRARGRLAEGARRPQRAALPGPDAAHQRLQRLLHPHLRPAPPQARPGGHAAHLRQRPRLQGPVRGLVLPPLRRLQDGRRDRPGQHLPDPPHPARLGERGELVLPPLDLPGAARAALRRPVGLRAPARALQRGALVHRRRAAGRLAQPREAQLGRAGPVGSRARLLRLVRRAAQLLHGALLRPRRRGPDRDVLARRLPRHRQGHPQVPRRLLARDAARRRPAAARAPVHPRLPADEGRVGRGAQDVQVARQRARPVRGHGPVRHRRAALLLLPRGLLRARRLGLDDDVRRALHVRARQRVRQPRLAHAQHDRPLLRRHRADRRGRRRAAARLRRARRRGRRPARPRGDHPGARPHLAARAAAEPLRRGERAVEAGEGPRAGRRAGHDAALARRGAARAHRPAHALHARVDREAARRARGRADRRWRRPSSARAPAAARSASCRRCSPSPR